MGINKFCLKKVAEMYTPTVSECLFFFSFGQAHSFLLSIYLIEMYDFSDH